jgi:hypothetical protein
MAEQANVDFLGLGNLTARLKWRDQGERAHYELTLFEDERVTPDRYYPPRMIQLEHDELEALTRFLGRYGLGQPVN